MPESFQDLSAALDRGVRRLLELQATEHATHDHRDGTRRALAHWEGEDIWNPMLPAQYAMAMHVLGGQELTPERKRRIVQQLLHERTASGRWGLHRFGEDSLFMTALAYVAARICGVSADDELLAPARAMFAEEDVLAIPSWGKIWLAIMNLYDWEGVNAVPVEAWLLPESLPLHPANYYCHTRLIYMGMASVCGLRLRAPRSGLVEQLRAELYPGRDYDALDFAGSRHALREQDLYAAPTRTLRAMYDAVTLFERARTLPLVRRPLGDLRRRILADIRERMRFELRSSDHTCLSPVNGLLFMLTLHAWDPKDPELRRQRERFDGWVWEDDTEGFRIAGARSATWDTSFAIQALAKARPELTTATRAKVDDALREALTWLGTQQIRQAQAEPHEYQAAYRVDPRGGFCFAGVWHGWPVSDCTAEALEAFLHAEDVLAVDDATLHAGVRFLLQCQNPDGGFGSYEAQKGMNLEWMNPAEMFGDSMTELSYVECTASNLILLCEVQDRLHDDALRDRVRKAIARAERKLRSLQNEDGSFDGAWGVAYLYGTLFGIRGLRAAGAASGDPAIQKARAFVRGLQRADGSWGEHWRVCVTERHEDLGHGHVTQSAWALLALAEAGLITPEDEAAMLRGSAWLASMQLPNGDWPEQEFAGVFFRTALIEYRIYRRVFPIWALSYGAALHRSRTASSDTPQSTARPLRA